MTHVYFLADPDCQYKPVDDHPEQFESKLVPGAIYNCPYGQKFDFDFFPCGCFPERVTVADTGVTSVDDSKFQLKLNLYPCHEA